jgi:hypothetical protein
VKLTHTQRRNLGRAFRNLARMAVDGEIALEGEDIGDIRHHAAGARDQALAILSALDNADMADAAGFLLNRIEHAQAQQDAGVPRIERARAKHLRRERP